RNSPKFFVRLSIATSSMSVSLERSRADVRALVIGRQRHDDVSGHADGEAAIGVVTAQPYLEGLDVALRPADIALGGVVGVDAAIEDGPLALGAGGQADGHLVAE